MAGVGVETGLAEVAPEQFAVGEPCDECHRPLSRYNPYTVCGPCRTTLAGKVAIGDGPVSVEWKRRQPVRRGPLGVE